MASENETVEAVCAELKEKANGVNVGNDGLVIEISQEEIWDACDRIESAWRRERAELRERLKEAIEREGNRNTCYPRCAPKIECRACVITKWRKALDGGES